MKNNNGYLVAIEGMDCAGKTNVIIPYFKDRLKAKFVADMKTGNISKSIRDIFMSEKHVTDKTNWATIAYLASAARSDMAFNDIKPCLDKGQLVFTDRYVDTSFVYNKKSDEPEIFDILKHSTLEINPDLVIFCFCSYEEMIDRLSNRNDNNQWDIKSEDSYNETYNKYVSHFKKMNRNVIMLDTSGSLDDTYEKLNEIIDINFSNYLMES